MATVEELLGADYEAKLKTLGAEDALLVCMIVLPSVAAYLHKEEVHDAAESVNGALVELEEADDLWQQAADDEDDAVLDEG